MKINSLYISAFGGIKNLKLDFNEGFNVIYGDNENGKSTIMAFIKMMFYGSDRGAAQISKNIRKKYSPWDGSAMAGSIDFTYEGKNYRLEREFRSSNSTDKATLCDLDFGTRQAVGSDIGSKYFGLSAAAFERSVFIGQFGFPEKDSSSEGEINSKLSNLVLTGDESVSFETVNLRLEKAKLALLSKSGRAGELDKNIKLCGDLKDKIELSETAQENYNKKVKDIAQAEEKVALMQKKADDLKVKISKEQDIKNAEKLKEFLELKAELDRVNNELKLKDSGFADEIYLGKLKFCISKVETANSQTAAKENEINALEKSLEAGLNPPADATEENALLLSNEIKQLLTVKAEKENRKEKIADSLNNNNTTKKSNLWIVLLILVICCSVLTGVLAFFVSSVLFPTVAATVDAVLLCVLTAVLLSNKSKEKADKQNKAELIDESESLEKEIAEITENIFNKKVRLETINNALSSSATVIEKQKTMLDEAKAELLILKQNEQEALLPLIELFSRYKPAESFEEIKNCLDEITVRAAKQKEIKNQLNFISRDIGSISYEQAKEKLAEISGGASSPAENFEELKALYEQQINSISEHKSAIAAAKVSAKNLISSAEDSEMLKKELKELLEKVYSQKEFCMAADIAMDILRESFGEVRRSYGSVLEKRAGEIFATLTDNRYNDMTISKSFDINVSETDNFGSREIDYLSSGAADQAYLSLRLAVAELISEDGEQLPILLDDSLTQYDDTRMNSAIKYLKEYSANSQMLMFTCHKAIKDSALNAGANSIIL